MPGLPQTDQERLLSEENEELRQRLAELEKDKVVDGGFKGEVPRYHLNGPCYLEDEALHEEGEEIEYTGTPMEEVMVPLNDAARAKLQERYDVMEAAERAKAELVGRPFMGLMTDNGTRIAQALTDARNMQDRTWVGPRAMPEKKGEIPAMPHLPEAAVLQRRRGRPPKSAKVVSTKAAPPAVAPGVKPEPILGSRYARASGEGSV